MINYIIQAKVWNQVEVSKSRKTYMNECWLWTGAVTKHGNYGYVGHRGKTYYAHRVAYETAINAELDKALQVRHMCNNSRCCNPRHLRPGTALENGMDRRLNYPGFVIQPENFTDYTDEQRRRYTLHARLWGRIAFPEELQMFYKRCWLWTATPGGTGYGYIDFEGERILAHRVAYMLGSGEVIPDDLLVRHMCNTPLCCNPLHLKTGTTLDNSADCVAAGRTAKGFKSGMYTRPEAWSHLDPNRHVLTETDIHAIRKLRDHLKATNTNDYGLRSFVMKKFNTTSATSCRILGDKTMSIVVTPSDFPLPPGLVEEFQSFVKEIEKERTKKRVASWQGDHGRQIKTMKLTTEQVLQIAAKGKEPGMTYRAISKEFNVSHVQVRNICLGLSRSEITGIIPIASVPSP